MKLSLTIMLCLICASCLPAQERTEIPIGSTVELSWLQSPDGDVIQYDAYFVSEVFVDTARLAIKNFSTVGDTNVVTFTQALPLGAGHVRMTATDSLGAQSVFSTDRAEYVVTNAVPGPPSLIRIKVVAPQPLKALRAGKKLR